MSMKGFTTTAILLLLAFCPASVLAQTLGSTISGTVVDQSDAVLPGVSLTLTEQTTNAARTVFTNDAGLFRFLELRPGRYSLRIEFPGFKIYEVQDIELATSERRDLGRIALQIGALTEEVTVTAQATAVQFTSAERSAQIDSTQLNDISLKGRDPYDYMRLLPGIVDTKASRDFAAGMAMSGITINGMSSGSKNVTLDGMNAVDQQVGNSTFVNPNLDAIAEIKLIANGYQAEYGRNAGGTINIITKSGTQDLHGSAYWNRRHESQNANSFFNNRQGVPRQIYRYFIGGYSVGGPVTIPGVFNTNRDKLFFFWSQEFTRTKLPTSGITANMPTDAEISGDFSDSRDTAGNIIPIIDSVTGEQFPGNIIPPNRIDPMGQKILNLFPDPNYTNPAPGQEYTSNFISLGTPFHDRTDNILRFDAQITNKLNAYFRYGHDSDDTGAVSAIGQGMGTVTNFLPGWVYTGHLTHAINPTTVNEVTFGWGRNNWGFVVEDEADQAYYRGSALDVPKLFEIPTGEKYAPYLPAMTFSGGSLSNAVVFDPGGTAACGSETFRGSCRARGAQLGQGSFWQNYNKIYSFQDDFSKIIGNHSLKAGVYVEKNIKNHDSGRGFNGNFNFGSTVDNPLDTGHGYANALLGVYQTYTQTSNMVFNESTSWTVEPYIQDNWRLTRRFTLDVGLRMSHMGALAERNNARARFRIDDWDPAEAARLYYPAMVDGKRVAIDRGTGATTFYALVNTIVPGSGNITNGLSVVDGNIYETPYLVFAPRLGFAWDVAGDGKTAVRGSFGVFYNRPTANTYGTRAGPPVLWDPTIYYNTFSGLEQAAESAAYSAPRSGGPQKDIKLERAYQANFTIQREIGFDTVIDAAWVGNFGRNGPEGYEVNPVPKFAYADEDNLFGGRAMPADLLRENYPGMGSLTVYEGERETLNYHAFQMHVRRRMTNGLQFAVAYTLSKAVGVQGWDPYNNQRDWHYGILGHDRTHGLSINYAYQLPNAGADLGWVRYITNNWTFSGITNFTSGLPAEPSCSSRDSGIENSDPTLSGGSDRCRAVADYNDFQQDFYNNFNVDAFALALPGTWGNTGPNILRQPSWSNWDMTLSKRIPIGRGERTFLNIRIEAYNIWNSAQFSEFGTTYQFREGVNTNSTTGQYTDTYRPRTLSTTVRFEF